MLYPFLVQGKAQTLPVEGAKCTKKGQAAAHETKGLMPVINPPARRECQDKKQQIITFLF
ncbi:hypothetical protein [Pantoea sp. At-9b]|uniref:hypothetical protein n=1 Tax=Pantoea sp. (strain At-9b) TaxID=592316 RepID=UPI0012370C54|nr:hypothetical protein [Pantoea sp. At-9b]